MFIQKIKRNRISTTVSFNHTYGPTQDVSVGLLYHFNVNLSSGLVLLSLKIPYAVTKHITTDTGFFKILNSASNNSGYDVNVSKSTPALANTNDTSDTQNIGFFIFRSIL